ncbi:MAG: hypothetical protein ACFFCP_11545, partial [Promethearchaeota archaeon]
HLTRIHDHEGLCKYKKGGTPCAFVNIKDLILLNEFPEKWRDGIYRESVKNIQKYLLSYDLSTADYPRQNPSPNKHWMNFAHFRSYQSSVFQGAEALVMSGIRNHKTLKKALKVVGSKCVDEKTWKTNYIQRKFPLQLEKGLSPWLTVSGLRIIKAFST